MKEIHFARDLNGEIICDKYGNPLMEEPEPEPSTLFRAMEMLAEAGMEKVAVLIPEQRDFNSRHGELGVIGIVNELALRAGVFMANKVNNRIDFADSRFDFYVHQKDRDIQKLKGQMYHSAIVIGKPSEEFLQYLLITLRLGKNHMVVNIF